jgi:hypothetical protein
MSEVDKKLMDPAANELIPSEDGPMIETPELSPGYVEKATRTDAAGSSIDSIENMLRTSTADPCGFDDGLSLRRSEGGGLRVYKNDLPVRDISGLEPFELLTIKKYLEGSH